MSADDWESACDPVPPRKELTDAEKRRRIQLIERARRDRGWLKLGGQAPSAYRVEAGFDEMGAE
jgi:hypothetical protein